MKIFILSNFLHRFINIIRTFYINYRDYRDSEVDMISCRFDFFDIILTILRKYAGGGLISLFFSRIALAKDVFYVNWLNHKIDIQKRMPPHPFLQSSSLCFEFFDTCAC